MPYKRRAYLPERVRKNFSLEAENAYTRTYNGESEQYGFERLAHRMTWVAVKRKYQKGSESKWYVKLF
jgi:cation transport regulator